MVKKENIQGSQPNIVLIVSDDHGYGNLGFREELSDIATPNLDRLRASACCWSRAMSVRRFVHHRGLA